MNAFSKATISTKTQSPRVVLRKSCSGKIYKIHRETTILEFIFQKVC